MDKVAVVILNYNGQKLLEKFLPVVIAHTPYPIYVADNQSTDDSVQFLSTHYPQISLIVLSHNFGFSEGYNLALAQVYAEYFILLNSDVEVTLGWVSPLLNLLEQNPDIAACQPKVLSYQHKDYFEYAGAAGGFIDVLGYPFCRGRLFTTLEQDRGQYNKAIPVFWATGACFAIRADVYRELGGFDNDFFAHLEEIDLCWRIYRAGWKVYCEPASVVYHVGGGTLAYHNPRKNYLNFRNSLVMLYKNSPTRELIWKMPLKIVLDWIASLKFLAAGDFSGFKTIYQAQVYFVRRFRYWQKKKRKTPVRSVKILWIYRKLIVFDYFFRKKRIFSRLKF